MFEVKAKDLGSCDVAVCGGGIAGVCAAVAAARSGAKVVLIEKSGCLGGTMTDGFMPGIMDSGNKGGIVKELLTFLTEHEMTCCRRGNKVDENGKRIPGYMIDTEGAKYFFDQIAVEAGVTVLFHSQIVSVRLEDDVLKEFLIATDCGNYSLSAKIYIDASGNGILSDLAGCTWECGDPIEGRPSPLSMSVCVGGLPEEYNGTDTTEDKNEYAALLQKNGIEISAQQATVVKLPSLKTWTMGFNFQYDVFPDDISALSRAVLEGRKEAFEVIEKHKSVPGFENIYTVFTGSHIGVREGRRVAGVYRLSDDDIIEGRRFDDGICLVTASVDVHKLKSDDTLDCGRGIRTKPYHIPYRCLVAKERNNLLLAGRCISGDFYPHASYRMMGNMAATGEAAGFAAAQCVKDEILPAELDGKRVSSFIRSAGYQL